MSKLNIPTPAPTTFNLKLFGLQNIAPKSWDIPEPQLKYPTPTDINYNPLVVNSGFLVDAGSIAEQQIKKYLTKALLPDIPEPTDKNVIIPSGAPNTMQVFNTGAALNGSPIYSNLEIDGFSWTDFNGQTKGFPGMTFNTVLMTVSQQKNIVETSIQGSDDGSVFEYSGLNNYEVTINIIITGSNQNGVYPNAGSINEGGVEDLIKMLKCPYPISVHSWYLQMYDILELVILDHDGGQEPGGISQQAITIKCKSNKNTTLIIQ